MTQYTAKLAEFDSLVKAGLDTQTYVHEYTPTLSFYYTGQISKLEAYQSAQPTFRLGYTCIHGTRIPTLLNLSTIHDTPTHFEVNGPSLDKAVAFIGYTPTQSAALAKALGLPGVTFSLPLNSTDAALHFDAQSGTQDPFSRLTQTQAFEKASDLFKPAQADIHTPTPLGRQTRKQIASALLSRDAFTQAAVRMAHKTKGGYAWDF